MRKRWSQLEVTETTKWLQYFGVLYADQIS